MSFAHYRIVLKLVSPLHIGKRKYRNLMETREHVPGRTLWGALTARITRDYFNGEADEYKEVGKFLIDNFRFGYLWPSLDGENPYLPWKHEDFDYLFKFGYMGQPIDYDKKATEEGQLHEVEFIGPRTREGQQVYLIGDLWIKNDVLRNEQNAEVRVKSKVIPLKSVFDTLQLGGERNYGWGRVKVESFEKIEKSKALGSIEVEINDEVILKFNESDYVTAHLLAADWEFRSGEKDAVRLSAVHEHDLEGEIEPLTGYMFRNSSFELPSPPICYTPGSKTPKALNVRISEIFGIMVSEKKIEGRG